MPAQTFIIATGNTDLEPDDVRDILTGMKPVSPTSGIEPELLVVTEVTSTMGATVLPWRVKVNGGTVAALPTIHDAAAYIEGVITDDLRTVAIAFDYTAI